MMRFLIFVVKRDVAGQSLYEENLVLIEGKTEEEFLELIDKLKKENTLVYMNQYGEEVRQEFEELVEIREILRDGFDNGIWEIASRSFDDFGLYRRLFLTDSSN